MEIIDTQKSLLENIYFFSGPILALLGLFIFFQIKLARNQLLIAKQQLEESQRQLITYSQRQAANLAADKVKEYTEILPLENKLNEELQKINYPKIKMAVKNFTNDETKEWDQNFSKAFLARPIEIIKLELDIINKLEAFSVCFVKGIADEKVAFNSIGRTFCNSITSLYPTITILRGSQNPNKYYEVLIQLYRRWAERLDSFTIEVENEKLSKELKDTIQKIEKLKDRSMDYDYIKPIGT